MSAIDVYLNISYVVYVIAPAVKDELWMRGLLMVNALMFAVWGLAIGNTSVAFWSVFFFGFSMFGITRLMRERRPVDLPDTLTSIRDAIFPTLANRQFLLFWGLGEDAELPPGPLVTEGEAVDRLLVLIDASATVSVRGNPVAKLQPLQFVGEMAFVSGAPASATVTLDEVGNVHWWAFSDIEILKALEPNMVAPLLGSINRDLAAKLRL